VTHPHYTLTAVFVDKVVRSMGDLDTSGGVEPQRGLAGLPLIRYFVPSAKYAWCLRRTSCSLGTSGPVIVHAHDVMSAYLARRVLPSLPQILTIHTIGSWVTQGFLLHRPHLRGSPVERFFRHVERAAVRQAETVVFTSKGAAGLFDADCPGILSKKGVRIVYTGVDAQEIDATPADPGLLHRYGIEGKRLLLSVAPHVREKGLHTLIEAIASLPPTIRGSVAVLIVGRGPATKELTSLIQERGLAETVKFVVEWIPDVIPLMKVADMFVLAPIKTVFDLVFLEAMAARVPIITTAVGGNVELFDDQSAILLPPDDPISLRDAIMRLLADEALRTSLAENAYRRVLKNFTLSKMLEGYLSLYGELV
jgi:D-inositol-3-phosphate glycosyltransferase